MFFHDTVVIVRAAVVRDQYDNDVPDWDNATRTTVTNVAVLPTSQVEDATGNRISLATGFRLYSKIGLDIDLQPADRIEWNGVSLEVMGEIARWPHPLRPGHVHHVEAELRKQEG